MPRLEKNKCRVHKNTGAGTYQVTIPIDICRLAKIKRGQILHFGYDKNSGAIVAVKVDNEGYEPNLS